MRLIALFLFLIFSFTSAFAFTDPGLIKKDKTVGFLLMYATETSDMSSGLTYKQKMNSRLDLEVLYTAYKSFYLLTKNITKIDVNGKYNLVDWGILSLYGILGFGYIYSPSVGGGLVGNVGGALSLKVIENLVVSVPLYVSFFSDGMWANFFAGANYAPNFWQDTELFAGLKTEAAMQNGGMTTGAGKITFYGLFGIRKGW